MKKPPIDPPKSPEQSGNQITLFAPAQTAISPAAVYVAGLDSPRSRPAMASALGKLCQAVSPTANPQTFPWWELRYEHTQALRSKLVEKYAPATTRKMLAALRGVLHACHRMRGPDGKPLISADDMTSALDLKAPSGFREPPGRVVEFDEQKRLFAAAAKHPSPRRERDLAMLSVELGGGLRRFELTVLTLESLDGSGLKFIGKRNKERRVPLPDGARKFLQAWIDKRGGEPGPLFMALGSDGAIKPTGLSISGINKIFKELCNEAQVVMTTHDFRRTYITGLFDRGVDISTIQGLAGHANANTSTKYDRRGERAKVAAAEAVPLPEIEE